MLQTAYIGAIEAGSIVKNRDFGVNTLKSEILGKTLPLESNSLSLPLNTC